MGSRAAVKTTLGSNGLILQLHRCYKGGRWYGTAMRNPSCEEKNWKAECKGGTINDDGGDVTTKVLAFFTRVSARVSVQELQGRIKSYWWSWVVRVRGVK